jgi:hypothetical protein
MSVLLVGCARVSTHDQYLTAQREAPKAWLAATSIALYR